MVPPRARPLMTLTNEQSKQGLQTEIIMNIVAPSEYTPAVYTFAANTLNDLDNIEKQIVELRKNLKAEQEKLRAFSINLLAIVCEKSAKEKLDYISGAVNALDVASDGKYMYPETRKQFRRLLPLLSAVYTSYNGVLTAFASRDTLHDENSLLKLADDLRTAKTVRLEKGFLAEYKEGRRLPYQKEGTIRFRSAKLIALDQREKQAKTSLKTWNKSLKKAKTEEEKASLQKAIEQAEKELAAVIAAKSAIETVA